MNGLTGKPGEFLFLISGPRQVHPKFASNLPPDVIWLGEQTDPQA